MTFDINSIRPTREVKPERFLIHGVDKIGKSTFFSKCPGVVFIAAEDGQESIDAMAFPPCKSWDDLLSAIGVLYTEKHDFKAVCIDSMDWAETLIHAQVCKGNNSKSIAEIGYGKGYVEAANMLHELLSGLNALRNERGMRVFLIAHTEIKRFDDPLMESYDRYRIKLHRTAAGVLQEWVDVIGFAQLATTVKKEAKDFSREKRNRAIDLDKRILCFERSVLYDAGNRFGLPAEIPLDWSEYEQALQQAREGKPDEIPASYDTE